MRNTGRNAVTVVILTVPTLFNANAQTTNTNEDEAADSVEVISVVGTNQSRYIVEAKDGASGLDLSFLENPRNVSFIPEQLVLDRKITTIEEALRNAPGVSAGDGFGGTTDDFFIRGFRRNASYRNGFRRNSVFKENLANVEYTQVVKGPAAITYGQVEPGGVVDVVTKRPLSEQRIAGELRYGSFNDQFALFDYSQPITDDLAVRLVGSTQDAESFRDFTDIKRDNVAFSARYYLADSTQFDFAYEWREEARPLDRGTIAIETSQGPQVINELLDVPFSQRFGSPWEIGEVDYQIAEFRVLHTFDDHWNIEANIAREDSTGNDLQSRPRAAFVVDAETNINEQGFITGPFDPSVIVSGAVYDDPTDRVYLVKRLDGSRNREITADLANIKLRGDFAFAGMEHKVILGADFIDAQESRRFTIGSQTDGVTAPFHSFISPVYALSDAFTVDDRPLDLNTRKDYGVYANLFTNVTENVGVLAGLRYSDTESENFRDGVTRSQTAASGVVPQLGLSYQVTESISLYSSYAESFEPNIVIPDNEGLVREIDPEEGEQVELGAKAELFNGRAQASVAVYQIDKVNVVNGLNDDGSPIFIDGRSSEGVEFSLTGQPTDGMNVTVSYAYTDAEDRDAQGNTRQAESIADTIFNVYASYEFQGGQLEGLGLGAGYYYESDRVLDPEGNLSAQLNLGDVNLVDLSAWYSVKAPQMFSDDGTIRFQLAVKNVFEDEYYGAGFTVLRIPVGMPRTVFGSVSFDF
ncbi:TonB-dependent siderophore receptor [Alteromonas sp. P256]|uniref:TonB-dependent siderophore receptor n=1 Tax=Alteromonas sp. P256 TaxID=3117399 RepID=UPI002FE3FE3D